MASSPLESCLEDVVAPDRSLCQIRPEKQNFIKPSLYLKDVKNSVWNLPNNLILSKANNNNVNGVANGNDSEIITNLFAHCKGARRYTRLENIITDCGDVNDNSIPSPSACSENDVSGTFFFCHAKLVFL